MTSPTTPQIPFLPDSAPFTPEQRGWLNGFLAGIFSGAPETAPAPQTQAASLNVAVLFASQGGNGEGLAKKMVKELKAQGHVPTLASLDTYTPARLAEHEHAVIFASTYGEGDPPDATQSFWDQLQSPAAPRLDKFNYTLVSLGDSNYEHFGKFGLDFDTRLLALGANRIAPRADCDVDIEPIYSAWKKSLFAALTSSHSDATYLLSSRSGAEGSAVALSTATAPEPKPQTHTRENPFLAPLAEKRLLTSPKSSKQTIHLTFSLKESAVHYEAGDACGVIPQNDPALVAGILQASHLTGTEPVDLPKGGLMLLDEALTHHLQITRLSRKLVEQFATMGSVKLLQDLLIPEQATHLEAFLSDRGLIDLLHQFPGVLTNAADIAALLPRLAPRLYSISSSPAAHRDEVHTTVAVVRYRAHNLDRGGVCSTLFADRRAVGDTLPIYIQPNKKFRLPADQSAPVIMIGPGTGIAPFRGFLHERQAFAATGKNWLFFGDRSAETDFLYQEELAKMQADNHLTHLSLAFSRDQPQKIYVQDKMLEHGAEFWSWLQDGATVYVCGDASRMAKDVDATLHTIAEREGHLTPEAAADFITRLKDDHRYHRDVY